jgi:hypothetical protein
MVDKKDIPPQSVPAGLKEIESILMELGIRYLKEHRFDAKRKFRFDVYLPDLKIGIEYEGLVAQKSGHTTYEGYTKDCTKYNLAQLQGIKVLRYTAFNFNDFRTDILKVNE